MFLVYRVKHNFWSQEVGRSRPHVTFPSGLRKASRTFRWPTHSREKQAWAPGNIGWKRRNIENYVHQVRDLQVLRKVDCKYLVCMSCRLSNARDPYHPSTWPKESVKSTRHLNLKTTRTEWDSYCWCKITPVRYLWSGCRQWHLGHYFSWELFRFQSMLKTFL